MIIPVILPRELGVGYLLRLAKINGFLSINIAIKKLKEKFQDPLESIAPNIPTLLSRALNISVQEYVKYHTQLPVLRGVTNFLPNILHGDPKYQSIINMHSSTSIDLLKSCEECIKEDLNYHGFIYYRTEHQFPGFDFCSKHSQILKTFNSGCYTAVSDDNLSQNKENIEQLNFSEHVAINRYRSILDSFSTSPNSIPSLKLVQVMQTKAKSTNISWSKKTNRKLMSDLVNELFPQKWIESIIPEFLNKKNGKYCGVIDCLMTPQKQAGRTCLYAIILSALYENADEALNDINDSLMLPERLISKNIKIDKDLKNSNCIRNIYIANNGLLKEISKEIGVSNLTTASALREAGLTALSNVKRNLKDALLDFDRGNSLIESCLKNNVKLIELELILRKLSTEQAKTIRLIDSANVNTNIL